MTGARQHLRWRPSPLMTVGTLLLLALFIGLGWWQLNRAAEKRALFQQFAGADQAPILTNPDQDGSLHRYRRVELRGRFLEERQFLLDNMVNNGRPGYHVLTPFEMAGSDRWLIVNRGWVAASASRSELPEVGVGLDSRLIAGLIDLLPEPGLRLDADSALPRAWPAVVVFPTVADLEQRLDQPLYGYQLLLDPTVADGFVREWRPRVSGPERHQGYALQWFSFAAILVVLFVTLNLRRLDSHE